MSKNHIQNPQNLTVVTSPLTPEQINKAVDAKGYISGAIPFPLAELMQSDLETLYDMIRMLFVDDAPLTNMDVWVAGFEFPRTVLLGVEGKIGSPNMVAGFPVYESPMTMEQLERVADDNGYVEGVVPVTLNEMREVSGWPDVLSRRLVGEFLEDVSYAVVGHKDANTIWIKVLGDAKLYLHNRPGFTVKDDNHLTYTQGDVRVSFGYIEEGLNGLYDESNPEDVQLLRLYVETWEDVWTHQDSHCTGFPTSASLEEKKNALKLIADELTPVVDAGLTGFTSVFARLTHITPEWV